MTDPTYNMDVINNDPAYKLAFELSEIDNDNAPIGWYDYIYIALHLIKKYNLTEKVKE